jgi:hypothetical protein
LASIRQNAGEYKTYCQAVIASLLHSNPRW